MLRKRQPAIEDRPFLGRLGAILSGEGTRRVKRDARKLSSIVRPAAAKTPKRKRVPKKQVDEKSVKRYLF